MKANETRTAFIQGASAEISAHVNAWLEQNGETEIARMEIVTSEDGIQGVFIIYRPVKETRTVGFFRGVVPALPAE